MPRQARTQAQKNRQDSIEREITGVSQEISKIKK
jgi:hypothetical protein